MDIKGAKILSIPPIFKCSYWRQISEFEYKNSTNRCAMAERFIHRGLNSQLSDVSPPLDVVQGGFRHQRSALDQAICLHDLMHSYRRRHNHYPVVAFLDIKSAYDTVDRRIIWQSMLASSAPLSLVSLLANMFDDVSVSFRALS
ncbi:hypothetical protein G6F20_013393 [Rhizopus arrhizus]|nr:hypothetical protein G6F20_013393 [Rhizopus arrhizus]